MWRNLKFWKHILWIEVLSVALTLGGLAAHTPASLNFGYLAYVILGLLVPLVYFLMNRDADIISYGKYSGAAHLAVWPSLVLVETVVIWSHQVPLEMAWRAHPVMSLLIWAIVLFLYIFLAFLLDLGAGRIYEHLVQSGRTVLRLWLGAVFFTGLIPGTLILTAQGLTAANPLHFNPYVSLFILLQARTIAFYLKIVLAMITFAVFLYFATSGGKAIRACFVIFTAVIWLILAFIPLILSLVLPGGSWRIYFDPSYLSIFPILSDLWLCGASIWIGVLIVRWIERLTSGANEDKSKQKN